MAAAQSKWTKRQILTAITVMLTQFGVLSSYSLLAPFFPQEGRRRGLGNAEMGVLFSAYQLVMFIMSPVYGLLVSHSPHAY